MKKVFMILMIACFIICGCACSGNTSELPTANRTPNPSNPYNILDFMPVNTVYGRSAEEFLSALQAEDVDPITRAIFNEGLFVPENIDGVITGFVLQEFGRYIYDFVEAVGFDDTMDSFRYEVSIKLNNDGGQANIAYVYYRNGVDIDGISERYAQAESIEGENAYLIRGKTEISIHRVYDNHVICITVPASYGDPTQVRFVWSKFNT